MFSCFDLVQKHWRKNKKWKEVGGKIPWLPSGNLT
jgi:hypothetical protein